MYAKIVALLKKKKKRRRNKEVNKGLVCSKNIQNINYYMILLYELLINLSIYRTLYEFIYKTVNVYE